MWGCPETVFASTIEKVTNQLFFLSYCLSTNNYCINCATFGLVSTVVTLAFLSHWLLWYRYTLNVKPMSASYRNITHDMKISQCVVSGFLD